MRFDRYVIVDWSANGKPKRGTNSIWIASCCDGVVETCNPRTRSSAFEWLQAHLCAAVARRERVLAGFDAAFGYPTGFAQALDLTEGPAWLATWSEVARLLEDDATNRNNRFEVGATLNERLGRGAGPFWGNGLKRDIVGLPRRKIELRFPWNGLAEFRATEVLTSSATSRPKSVWQLSGAGTVGGQTLTLLPVLAALRSDVELARRVHVWPFETGFTTPSDDTDGSVVIAEVWPSALPAAQIAAAGHDVFDADQVDALARHFEERDRAGALAAWFKMPMLDTAVRRAAVEEEGWILWSAD